MNRQATKKVTLVDFFRSIQFNEQNSKVQRGYTCDTHFASLVSRAHTTSSATGEENKLVRSAN